MPIVNRRPHIIQLLDKAVQQNVKIAEINRQFMDRPASLWFLNNCVDDCPSSSRQWTTFYNNMMIFSRFCERLHNYRYFAIIRRVCWPIAFSVIVYEAPKFGESKTPRDLAFFVLDLLVNIFFMLDSLSRFFGLPLKIQIEKVCKREMSRRAIMIRSGVVDIIVTALCFAYGFSDAGLWFRLFRLILITASAIEMVPQLDVLMSGISSGLKSIFFTIVVFALVLLFYSAVAHHLYHLTDPLHFGTFIDSFLTLFQVSTFDNWTQVYYTVSHGCKNYPGDYSSLSFASSQIHTAFGTFPEPECRDNMGQPAASAVVFITFAFLEGYIMVSLNLAAVAIGINERLAELRDLSEFGELDEEEGGGSGSPQPLRKVGSNRPAAAGNNDNKAAKLLGNNTAKESKAIAAILAKVWDLPPPKDTEDDATTGLSLFAVRDFHSIVMSIKMFIMGGWNENFYAVCVLIDAVLQFIDEDSKELYNSSLQGAHWFFQVIFLIDVIIRCVAHADNPRAIIKDNWAIFAFALTAVNFVTLLNPGSDFIYYHVFASGRILRLVAILKVFRFMPDLACILNAMDMSLLCMVYVFTLMGIFLCYFAIGGVLLFKSSVPYFFGSIQVSLQTLIQSMTQDNWSYVMRAAQYGCSNFGFNTGVDKYDASCITTHGRGQGVGYWSPIYFVIFIVVAAMVLVSLLVGVIITSLELDREDLLEEEEVKAKLRVVQRRYHLQQNQITLLLGLFEKYDANADGALAFEEIVIILDSMKMNNAHQFEFFLRVDTDKSGQIDFAEFCEMIALLGQDRKYAAKHPEQQKPAAPAPAPPPSSVAGTSAMLISKGLGQVRDALGKAASELLRDGKDDEDSIVSRRAKRSARVAPSSINRPVGAAPNTAIITVSDKGVTVSSRSTVAVSTKEERSLMVGDTTTILGSVHKTTIHEEEAGHEEDEAAAHLFTETKSTTTAGTGNIITSTTSVRQAYELVPSAPSPNDVQLFGDVEVPVQYYFGNSSQKSVSRSENHSVHSVHSIHNSVHRSAAASGGSGGGSLHIGAFSRQSRSDYKYNKAQRSQGDPDSVSYSGPHVV